MPCEKLQSNIAHSAQTVNGCLLNLLQKTPALKI